MRRRSHRAGRRDRKLIADATCTRSTDRQRQGGTRDEHRHYRRRHQLTLQMQSQSHHIRRYCQYREDRVASHPIIFARDDGDIYSSFPHLTITDNNSALATSGRVIPPSPAEVAGPLSISVVLTRPHISRSMIDVFSLTSARKFSTGKIAAWLRAPHLYPSPR